MSERPKILEQISYCPFCGKLPTLMDDGNGQWHAAHNCTLGHWSTPWMSAAKLLKAWNTRALP